jgi:hypothetical protein
VQRSAFITYHNVCHHTTVLELYLIHNGSSIVFIEPSLITISYDNFPLTAHESLRIPEIKVGRLSKEQPTPEVLVDTASILAGAGNLYLDAISVDQGGMLHIFGYMD